MIATALIPATALSARRIRFLSSAPPEAVVVREFSDPYRCLAVAETLTPEELPLPGTGADPVDEFYFLFVPGGAATPFEQQKQAEQWMARPEQAEALPTIEVMLRSDRILWRPGQAMLQGSAERLDELLAGLVDFAFYEGELRRLECGIEADWNLVEADVALTHKVDDRARRRWPHVAAMTERTTRRRICHVRLERHLEKASLTLSPPVRRLVAELASQAETQDRLQSVDDRLEVFEDLYELANDRISEFSYFQSEYSLEWLIVLLLVLEVVLLVVELFLHGMGM